MKLLRSANKNYMEFELTQVHETDGALFVSDGGDPVWIPKSQLEDDPEYLDNGLVRIVIAEWLAKEKGLI